MTSVQECLGLLSSVSTLLDDFRAGSHLLLSAVLVSMMTLRLSHSQRKEIEQIWWSFVGKNNALLDLGLRLVAPLVFKKSLRIGRKPPYPYTIVKIILSVF